MPSFRKAPQQAAHAVGRVLALGTARHTHRRDGRVHAVGTARAYEAALTQVAQWLKAHGHLDGLHRMTPAQAQAYLAERAQQVRQKTLDLDRQALQMLPNVPRLARVFSALGPSARATQGRAYTPAQVARIAAAQTPAHALATAIALAAGLRAHELLTLRPAGEQPASGHRTWAPQRFVGLTDVVRYSVVGKGGLVREVALPAGLAARLEAVRLPAPQPVTDRRVHYVQHYALGGGHAWTESFRAASVRVLGWSRGAHGLRHAYAQTRLAALQGAGLGYREALGVVSQEMGHFRPAITGVYLR